MDNDFTSQAFFEEKYVSAEDPWYFATSSYEQNRYDIIVAALGDRRFQRAFEPGCSIGVLTERLAPLCDELEAMDISPTAVARARERCRSLPNVRIRQGALPDQMPEGTFDLIVFSEIGYYFDSPTVSSLSRELVSRLRDGGIFLASHWSGVSREHVIRADELHEILAATALEPVSSGRYEGFRLDCWRRV